MVGIRTRTIGAASLLVTAALTFSACTSEPASDLSTPPVTAGSTSALGDQSSSPPGSGDPQTPAGRACGAYFELDLLNSTYVGGAVKQGDMTESQVRTDFARLLRTLVRQGRHAVDSGDLTRRFLNNAERMRRAVNSVSKSQPLSAVPKKQKARFVAASSRVQRMCARAGYPLPEDNNVAREAVGLTGST